MIKKLVWLAVLVGLLLYSIPKLLEQLSLMVEKLGTSETIEEERTILFPPIIDTQPEATNSSKLTIKGFAQNADRVEIFNNDILKDTITIGTKDGSFISHDISLYDGSNSITAVALGFDGERSNPSEPLIVFFKNANPKLVVESPEDGSHLQGSSTLELRGITDPENSLTVNGRWTRVQSEGTFRTQISLVEGENRIEVIARDRAGNETKITRLVTYSK